MPDNILYLPHPCSSEQHPFQGYPFKGRHLTGNSYGYSGKELSKILQQPSEYTKDIAIWIPYSKQPKATYVVNERINAYKLCKVYLNLRWLDFEHLQIISTPQMAEGCCPEVNGALGFFNLNGNNNIIAKIHRTLGTEEEIDGLELNTVFPFRTPSNGHSLTIPKYGGSDFVTPKGVLAEWHSKYILWEDRDGCARGWTSTEVMPPLNEQYFAVNSDSHQIVCYNPRASRFISEYTCSLSSLERIKKLLNLFKKTRLSPEALTF